MRAGLLLWLILMGFASPAQTTKRIDYDSLFQRRMAGLSPLQRIGVVLQYIGFLNGQSRFAEARSMLQRGLEVARQNQLDAWSAKLYEYAALVETTAGNHVLAVTYYFKALDLYRSLHTYDQQQLICSHIADEYKVLQNQPKSQEYEQLAEQLHRDYNQITTLTDAYKNKADKFEETGQIDSALVYIKKVMTVFWVRRSWPNYYNILDGYGGTLTGAGRYREAEQTFQQCLTYSLRQGDKRREMYEYMHLPEPLLHLNRLEEAQQYAILALDRIERDPERQDEHRAQVYDILTRIAETKGQFKQALAYERLRNQYLNTVQSVEKSRQIAEVEARYQTAQKQLRINQLDQANRRQLDQISWLANGLVALAGLLFLILWQYRTIRRVNTQLSATNSTISEKNRQISEQADKLGVLMQELHHRVKNNLAIVSGLLRMQSKRLNDPRAIQAVQDGQRRVEAISLIHQQLYQTDNLADVAMKAYLIELTEGLLLGYGFDPDQFDCELEVDDIRLDVEIAVPLGLILNEVLTNAFKYAYADVERPALHVRLQSTDSGEENKLIIEVQDNGPGLEGPGLEGPGLYSTEIDNPSQHTTIQSGTLQSGTLQPGSIRSSSAKDRSFGQRLIRELVSQLGGEMSLTSHQGTYFRLVIPMEPEATSR